MDWYQRSACSLLGFHFLKRSGVKLFSLVAIDEETFNLDDLVEAKIQIEIPVGKGIPTSRIVKVGDLQRPVSFRPIPVSAGTRVGQPNEMRLLQRKRKRGPESALIQTGRVDRQTGNSASQAKTVSWAALCAVSLSIPNPIQIFNFKRVVGRHLLIMSMCLLTRAYVRVDRKGPCIKTQRLVLVGMLTGPIWRLGSHSVCYSAFSAISPWACSGWPVST